MATLTKRKAIKDHTCDGPCKIKRIHAGTKYFVLQEPTIYRHLFSKPKKYHPWCLPEIPFWMERAAIFPQRRRNRRKSYART